MGKNFFERTEFNTRLIETDNFIVVPSLGSLVEGWVLIVPKQFHLNFSLLEKNVHQELSELIERTESMIYERFSTTTVLFEHGPASKKSNAGCGVDYAHLHIVPVDFDLQHGLKHYLGVDYSWLEIDGISDIQKHLKSDSDYIYLRNQKKEHFLAVQKEIPSQMIRKVIAHYLGTPDRFDWKQFPESNRIRETIERLQQVEFIE